MLVTRLDLLHDSQREFVQQVVAQIAPAMIKGEHLEDGLIGAG